jgi:hypothetical protein
LSKRSIYLLGLITLFLFPIPTFLGLYWFEDIFPLEILQIENLSIFKLGIGIQLGIVYAFLVLLLMQATVFKKVPSRVENLVKSMNLNLFDCIFISICAGIGEELLFRSGVQFYAGPIITTLIFVAIHGYLNPFNWKMSLYGLIVMPFIFIISYGYYEFGLWFSIGAHFSYDFVLLIVITKSDD